MQHYIEKWLQIIFRMSGVRPPQLPQTILLQLDTLFMALQEPFEKIKPHPRKNFLNYNYVFRRLLQHLGIPKYGIFFPLIKSKSKLNALDDMWMGTK